jgi:hypothetical protein
VTASRVNDPFLQPADGTSKGIPNDDRFPLWDREVDGPSLRTLSRSLLLRRLVLAALLRALITVCACMINLFVMSLRNSVQLSEALRILRRGSKEN